MDCQYCDSGELINDGVCDTCGQLHAEIQAEFYAWLAECERDEQMLKDVE